MPRYAKEVRTFETLNIIMTLQAVCTNRNGHAGKRENVCADEGFFTSKDKQMSKPGNFNRCLKSLCAEELFPSKISSTVT